VGTKFAKKKKSTCYFDGDRWALAVGDFDGDRWALAVGAFPENIHGFV